MPNTSLSSRDRAPRRYRSQASKVVAALQIARAVAPGMTLTQLLVFLTVAEEEGLRLNELRDRTDESQATISRSVAMLFAGHRGSTKSGYGLLVLLRDAGDGRGRRAALSDVGQSLLARIETALQPDPELM
jgi:DNA-binding MarR family transcriptional regulator